MGKEQKLTYFCEERFQKQCLSKHGTIGCKLRYFRGQCPMALKVKKEKETKVRNE